MRRGLRFLLLVVLLVPALSLLAGETGSISGKALDVKGEPIPGVVVKVVGPQLPAGRTTSSSAAGTYNFQRLLPGTYTVSAELQGLGKAARSVNIHVDNDYQIDLVLKGGTEAAVEVLASSVDTKSSEVNFNFTAEAVKDLPLPRSYSGMLQLVPGAASPDAIGTAVAGGSRQDNKYMVDGVSVTNPGYGSLGIETNQLDIADFSVKTGGITAEFGRTQGAMINAVTKSGTNDLHGALRVEAQPASFRANYISTVNQDSDLYQGAASLGFPIVKDVLFGYASGRFTDQKLTAQVGPLGKQADTTIRTQDYFGKVTANIGTSLLVNTSFRALPAKTENGFNSLLDAPTAAYGSDATNLVGNVTASWFVSNNSFVEAKYVHTKESDLTQAQTILSNKPLQIDPTHLGAYGAYTDPVRGGNVGVYQYSATGDDYLRDEFKLSASQFLDLGPTQHQLKIGGGYEDDAYNFVRESNGWGSFTKLATTWRTDYYNTQPKQLGRGRTYSLFLQDTMTWGRVSVTAGVLFNKDDFAQICPAGSVVCGGKVGQPLASETRYNFATFDWGKEVQPRLGIVYNTELIKGDKAYVSYGKYAGLDQKSAARSWAPYRIRQDYENFDLTGKWLSETVRGASTGKIVPSDLKAPYQDEIILGYAAPVTRSLSVEVYYQYRALHDALEDAPIDPNNYNGSYKIENLPWARRYYRGATIDINKRFSDSWSADVNYTYSKLEGNFDLDYSASVLVFNNSSILEDGPGANTFEPNRNGTLWQDRPHVLKVFTNYAFPSGISLGAYYRFQSGTAWQAQGRDATGGTNRYLEPAGSRRLPGWSNLDLSTAYTFGLAAEVGLRLELRVQNVFNTQAILGVNRTQYLDPYVDGTPKSTLGPQGTSQPNSNFGVANSWSTPRRIVVTAQLDF